MEPTVSVLIPTFQEEAHIGRVLEGFQNSGYPGLIEILVADGGSTDRTREIVQAVADSDARVRLLDNPDRIQSAALNRMIGEARGQVLVRADAHCIYASDYVPTAVQVLLRTHAVCVGGAQRFIATNPVQAGIALSVRSWIGSGNARYRDETYSGPADTVFLGVFRKEVFDTIGLFRTDLFTNEDTELNLRIHTAYPNRMVLDSGIQVWYYPRSSWRALWKQYFRYGRGVVKTGRFHGFRSRVRAHIPFGIFMTWAVLTLLWPTLGSLLALGTIACIGAAALQVALDQRESFERDVWKSTAPPPDMPARVVLAMVAALLMNVAHAFGYATQLLVRR